MVYIEGFHSHIFIIIHSHISEVWNLRSLIGFWLKFWGTLVEGDFFLAFLTFLLVEGLQLGFCYMNSWFMSVNFCNTSLLNGYGTIYLHFFIIIFWIKTLGDKQMLRSLSHVPTRIKSHLICWNKIEPFHSNTLSIFF